MYHYRGLWCPQGDGVDTAPALNPAHLAPGPGLAPRPLPTLSSSGAKFGGCKSDCAFQGKNGEERWPMTPGEEAGRLPALFPGPGLSLLWEREFLREVKGGVPHYLTEVLGKS